jgi:xanthine dehydrogenase small subunit
MRDFVLIYVNGRRHEIRGETAFQSLSSFLREQLGLTGTKIVCAEGDCGSCTVLLGKPRDDTLDYKPVCSCIQYLFQLDGTHIITVEGLAYGSDLNPVQEAMVRCHGAQCGFCTPGFVVSMCALLDERRDLTDQDLRRGLVGNLCRCTGYASILEAGRSVDTSRVRPLRSLYATETIAAELSRANAASLLLTAGEHVLFKPTTVQEAVAFKDAHADCTIFSGGTDLGVQLNKGLREVHSVLSTRSLTMLEYIDIADGELRVGAGASIAALEEAAKEHLPEYGQMLEWFGSRPIKNAATIGGNIANGSPIGDSMPGLFVLNGEVEMTGLKGSRRVNINEFYTGYKRHVITRDELITRVYIPLPASTDFFRVYKISKRKDLDISTFMAAFWMRPAAGRIADIRIAYGGVGPTIERLRRTEDFLRGKSPSEETFQAVGAIACEEIRPIADVRGSADFRMQLARNILLKFAAEFSDATLAVSLGSNGNGRH